MLATRDQILQMHPRLLRPYYMKFDTLMVSRKLNYRVTCVGRMIKEQVALYAQGREDWQKTNLYRSLAGLPPLEFKEDEYNKEVFDHPGKNRYVVTWTINSEHVINLDDGNPDNDWSRAFDIVMLDKDKRATYDLKCDVLADGIPDYINAAKCGVEAGLVAGANFKKTDYPHYQTGLMHG